MLKRDFFENILFRNIFLAYFIMLRPMNVFFELIFLNKASQKFLVFSQGIFVLFTKSRRAQGLFWEKVILDIH
jgi:hypothetical protein